MEPLKSKDKWFFLNGVLHRALAINRFDNYVKAFDYDDHRVKMYKWDDTIHSKERAFGLKEVAEFINRKPRTMRFYIEKGIATPSGIAQRGQRKPIYYFTKQDVLELRDAVEEYSSNAPYGRIPLPTREQLRSMLSAGSVLYIKDGEDFVPVWEAKF